MRDRKGNWKNWIEMAAVLAGIFGLLRLAARGHKAKAGEKNPCRKPDRADNRRSKRRNSEDCRQDIRNEKARHGASIYERYIKRTIDKVLSLAGLVILAPVYGLIALAIVIDDPGPVLFTQKRVGKNKRFFMLHKFRSMKMSTPHDVPTHQLKNPEQYITRVGKILRKYSLDELPQIWDIFRGEMSIIGPRPALWNQDDLVAERDKYGANDVKPGLTGWAQINGRDELEIADKARLDGEYVKKLRQGGMKALFFDVKCFLETFLSVIGSDGVVEGGTGELQRAGNKEKNGADADGKICRERKGGETYQEKRGSSKAAGCRGTRIFRKKADEEIAKTENRIDTVSAEDAGFADYGYLKHFEIDTSEKNRKRVLITGAGSYIGESFERWAEEHYPANFTIDTVDMQKADWRKRDFSSYDAVFHVAGIAHADVGKVSEEEKKKYYAVNTDLAIETAEKAKAEGVKQFVLMSSMIIYGDSAPYGKEKVIDEKTLPQPSNFYGDSKWQADKGVRKLADEKFRVAVLRPPMIYGKGSKGNYQTLVKLAKKLPVFPDVENRRSMLYIDNLCEFLCKLTMSGEGGVYFPQNKEYTKTSEMVKMISNAARLQSGRDERRNSSAGKRIWAAKLLNPAGKGIRLTKLLNTAVVIGSHVPGKISGLVDKAFGNCVYRQRLSEYEGMEYQQVDLKTSVICTVNEESKYQKPESEKGDDAVLNIVEKSNEDEAKLQSKKKRILILVNHDVVIYNFRLELVERLLDEGYEVHISSPYGERIDDLVKIGAKYHKIDIERHGMNPVKDFGILLAYKRLMESISPVIVLGYTIKPNIYGAMTARSLHIPFVANITGLGTATASRSIRQNFIILLYKAAFTEVQKVFFQNEENKEFFKKNKIAIGKHELLPGSGVNLERYTVVSLPDCGDGQTGEPVKFAFISRIMKEKGIDQYLIAAEVIRRKYPMTEFHVCGFCEEEYEGRLDEMNRKGIVIYHGMIRDVARFMSQMHCIVHPSYYPEGLSNVLLEACACGRAIITTNRAGCREAVKDGMNGYMIWEKDSRELIMAVEKFINLPWNEKRNMGLEGRRLATNSYDRRTVIEKYMEEVKQACMLVRGKFCE